ncbi:MAG: hypothetical protein OEZ36_00095 [Spirochaetota bacterium]|nr:hypothetical protein [Spirochaetota bacterium]
MLKTFITHILLILTLSVPCFSWSSDFDRGFQAFLQEDYETAIKHLKIATRVDRNSKSWHYLGLSQFHLYRYREAKESFSIALNLNRTDKLMDPQMIIKYLSKTIATLKANEPYANPGESTDKTFYFVIILGIMGGIAVTASIVAIFFFRRQHGGREYKEHTLGQDLIAILTKLNHEFKEAKALIHKSDSQDAKDDIGEIEDRCIALNDKLEELKYGLRALDEETFKDEIEITREMITKCVAAAKEVQEV